MTPVRELLTAAVLVSALTVAVSRAPPAHAAEPDSESESEAAAEERPKLDVLNGKLSVRKTDDGSKRLDVEIGKTRYRVLGADTAKASKLARKHVRVLGLIDKAQDALTIELGEQGGIEAQERTPVQGTVRPAPGRKGALVLEGNDVTYAIARADSSKFKSFAGKHVESLAFLVSGPGYAALASVKAVERKLLPGEREPKSGAEAIAGTWVGRVIAVNVPGGVPNVKKGDSFPMSYTTDAKFEKTTGRLMNQYDVVGTKLRKFHAKKRTADVEFAYSFGSGSYAIRLIGAFSEDWKTFTGEWTSGFVGGGTFELRFGKE